MRPKGPLPTVVMAPAPTFPPGVPIPANRVATVVLRHGERVEWIWTARPDGAKWVSAYRIHRDVARTSVTLRRPRKEG